MASPYSYGRARYRTAPSLPFGWGAVTVLLVGAALMIVGIVMILWGMYAFITGTIGAAISDSFSITGFFSSFFGAVILFVIGGILAGAGGWLMARWWIFLLVGAGSRVAPGDTARDRDADRAGVVRGRRRRWGRVYPEQAKFCMSCSQPPCH